MRSRGAVVAAVLVVGVALGGCAQQAAPASPVGSTTNTTEPLRINLCDNPGDLTAWMRADGLPVDDARCTGEPADGRTLRAFGKWTFPPTGRNQPHVESVEIAVSPDRGKDGSSAFDDLKGSYPPHEQRSVAGHYSRVANARGRTLVNLPELAEPLNITVTSAMTNASDPEYAKIRAAHLGALEQIVPALARS
ncbi:hypothetical protein FHS29_006761 [Saccharothrix tamanrassetensis]|uniref:Lipoprotein n=1 Tax=Saccharothrix tamanrassetensis TaxID=1051531 RepID=A0A841CVH3_9PSEU|nr:hypothetical protein [Saccharothrix tamanrassetensis]MBB5960138.1 hypothetical protein [Saccharothrix tamanrassetensis]